jgi:hypothetical protein
MVRKKLHTDWDRFFESLRRTIIVPLAVFDTDASRSIETDLEHARQRFEARLDEDPRFWRTVNLKLVFMEKLAEELESVSDMMRATLEQKAQKLSEANDRIGSQRRALDAELQSFRSNLTDLQAAQVDIEREQEAGFAEQQELDSSMEAATRKARDAQMELTQLNKASGDLRAERDKIQAERIEIEQRVKTLQSPFGALPVGLAEAVLTFPIFVVVGFWICVSSFCAALRLRREFHRVVHAVKSDQPAETGRMVAILTPLWLDPLKSTWITISAGALLLSPLLVYVVSVGLVQYDWELDPRGTSAWNILHATYNGLYAAGALMFVLGAWRVASNLVDYGAELRLYAKGAATADANKGSDGNNLAISGA